MSILERARKRREKKQQEPSAMPESSKPQASAEQPLPATGDLNTPDSMPMQPSAQSPTAAPVEARVINDTPNPTAAPSTTLTSTAASPDLTISRDNTPEWVKAGSYEDLVKINPNVSRTQYAYNLAKYRREQGQPDMTYQEWANILKNQDPYETEAERQKREKRLRRAEILNGVGAVLGNLVNYVRTRNGNVAMNLDDGTQGYNRLDRLRQGREQLARSNAKDYLGIIAQDRAERAKEASAAAAAAQRERDYRFKEAELKVKIENARSDRERKAAADELARMKFKHQKETDAAKLKETQRHNQAQEAVSWHRAKNGGGNNKYLELETSEGKKRYTPGEHGTNWVHKAYQDMLKAVEKEAHSRYGDKTETRIGSDGKEYKVKLADEHVKKFKIEKNGGGMFGSSTPSEQEMYEAITKYNESQWTNRNKTDRYKQKQDVSKEDMY